MNYTHLDQPNRSSRKMIGLIAGLAIVALVAVVAYRSGEQGAATTLFESPQLIGEEERAFIDFVSKHRKFYLTRDEYSQRLAAFTKHYNSIKKVNSDPKATYTAAINKFSDMTHEEFIRTHTGYKPQDNKNIKITRSYEGKVAASVDNRGLLGDAKDQKTCGSCWAFATIATLEAANKQKSGTPETFSEQQLVDCAKENHGCDGGDIRVALEYTQKNAVQKESDYAYVNKQETCKQGNGVVQASSVGSTGSNSAADLQREANAHVMSVTIFVNNAMQNYKSGVFNSCDAGSDVNHAVTLVGYGNDNGEDYWLIRNSWAKSWGEEGHIRIKADFADTTTGNCAILRQGGYYPVL